MVQIAKVVGLDGDFAEIEVSRKAMCDGCHKTECGGKCAMSALFSSGSTMTAQAENVVGAKLGDTVEIQTSDREVIGSAIVVFVLPVVMGILFYVAGNLLKLSSTVSSILAIVGFAFVFPFMKIIEMRKRKKGPSLIVTRIIDDNKIPPTDGKLSK